MNTLRIMVVQVTRKHDFGYSLKNIPIPSKKEYLKELTHSVEKFVRNLRWRAHFFLNPNDRPSKETYGFKSIRAPPQIKELKQFEDRLFTLIRNIEFRPYTNTFQEKLRRDIKVIEDSDDVFVAADKTTNYYKLTPAEHDELLQKNIQKDYKKVKEEDIIPSVMKQIDIVEELDIDDRVMYTQPQEGFITVKDHKDNYMYDPKCRLLNPTKMEIGKIGKKILSKAIEKLKVRTGLKLWKNTESVLSWFNRLENKDSLRFIGFDIQDYYTSISEELFKEALAWAGSMVEFSDKEIEVIMESKRTLLYTLTTRPEALYI